MGLTIHYDLRTDSTSIREVKQKLRALRQVALDLPLESVSELVEFKGDAAAFTDADRETD